jgi:acetyl esterase/lipase
MMSQALDGVRIVEDAGLAVPARMIESDGFADEGLVVYVPGGSFVVGLSPRLTALVARIAKAAATKTCIVEYRLAPEHPCPAAVEDVERAVEDLLARGANARRLVLLAESAGAAIALAAVRRLRDRGVELAGLCLLSPWTDLALTGLSLVTRSLSSTTGTRMEFPAICSHLYLQGLSPFDPVASPVYGDLGRLPPILVQTSRGDAFHDDARTLADRAYRAGTDVTLRVWPGAEHVCEQAFDGQSTRAIEAAAAFIRARLG